MSAGTKEHSPPLTPTSATRTPPTPRPIPSPAASSKYWRILRRRKGTLILIACLGAIVGFLVTIPQTPIYQARTSLEIVALNQNFLNIKESNPLSDGGDSIDTTDIQTHLKILQSDSLIDRVLAKLKSDPVVVPETTRLAAWRKLLNLEPQQTDPREEAILYAQKNYNVRVSPQTRIIEITVDSMSPQIATDFANTLTSEFIDQNLESRWQTTQHTSDWLSRQLDDMRIRLEQSEDRLQAYAHQAGLLFTGDQQKNNVSEEKLLQLQQALSSAQTDRISKQSRWEMANSSPADALPDVLNDTSLRDYQSKLTEMKRQIAELHATYTDESPKVQKVQVQLATIENALSTERADILKRIKNEYDEALRRESLLTADYSAQRAVVTGESGKAVQYDVMKHEVESNRQLYDAMLQQLKQATLASALRASNIRVVDPAKLPKRPYKPEYSRQHGAGPSAPDSFSAPLSSSCRSARIAPSRSLAKLSFSSTFPSWASSPRRRPSAGSASAMSVQTLSAQKKRQTSSRLCSKPLHPETPLPISLLFPLVSSSAPGSVNPPLSRNPSVPPWSQFSSPAIMEAAPA